MENFFASDWFKLIYIMLAWIFIFMILGDGIKQVIGVIGLVISTGFIALVAIGAIMA